MEHLFNKETGKQAGEKSSRKGIPNLTTEKARNIFLKVMNDEMGNIGESLIKIREDSHLKYLEVLTKLLSYYFPKKMDITSGDKPINKFNITIERNGKGN